MIFRKKEQLYLTVVILYTFSINLTSGLLPPPEWKIMEENDIAPDMYSYVQGKPIDLSDTVYAIAEKDADKEATLTTKSYRLPDTIYPEHYDLKITTYLDTTDKRFSFDGEVTITLTPVVPTNQIIFNFKNISIAEKDVKLQEQGTTPKDIKIKTQTSDTETEKYTITTDTALKQNIQYKLTMKYKGNLIQDDLKGFYRSSYKNGKDTVYLATTQFEPTGARRAFPCFDEPKFKATFQLTLVNEEKYTTVLSNTKGTTSKPDKDKMITTTFVKTPKMSTYLLAFVVSDFKCVGYDCTNKDEKLSINVYANPNIVKNGVRSYQFGKLVIEEIGKYINVPYTDYMKQIYQVAIPDFAAGAMENWGLVTYREPQLIFDPAVSTSDSLHKIYTTIAHEFGHQWFGDLVTPPWWNDIWLNEGFASYFGFIGADLALPKLAGEYKESDWRLKEQFAVKQRHPGFVTDSLPTTRPLSSIVESPNEIASAFDNIVYNKGGSVLFMLEHILTTAVWKQGLNKYLTENKLSSVRPSNLWKSLDEAYQEAFIKDPTSVADLGGYTMQDIGNSWTYTAGYPVVTVHKTDDKVVFKQHQFWLNGTGVDKRKATWLIPINYVLSSKIESITNTKPMFWLTSDSRTFELTEGKDDFILANNLQTGYYRVNYDEDNWKKIAKYLNKSETIVKVPAVTLAQIVDDSLNLARVGQLKCNVTLPLLQFLHVTSDYIPWYAAVNSFKFLDVQLHGAAKENRYKNYHKMIIEKAYKDVNGFKVLDNDTQISRLNRMIITKRACDMGLDACLKDANDTLKPFLEKEKLTESIKPDLQEAIYCGAARNGTKTLYDKIVERMQKVPTTIEKQNIARGLGCFEDEKVLKDVLNNAITKDDPTKAYGSEIFISAIESGSKGLEYTLDFYVKNYDKISSDDGLGAANAKKILQSFANQISQKTHLDKLKKLDSKFKKDEELKTMLQNVKDQIQVRVDWNDQYLEDIEKWLKDNVSSATSTFINMTLLVFGVLITYLFGSN